jgi:uncharacterized protein (TIGR03435 family)
MKLPMLLFVAAPVFCQQAFTVASVKPSGPGNFKPVVSIDPGRVSLTGVTFESLITRAYGVKYYQVTGPDWISNGHYDVVATMPPDTPPDAVWQMLQTLLAERFQLKLRRTTQEMPVYAVVTAKGGPKLKPAEGGETSARFAIGRIEARNVTIGGLANLIGKMLDRPIVDQTELQGAYDITLEFAPDATLGPGMAKMTAEMAASRTEAAGPSLFTAFEQLGLRLEPRKLPTEMLVVESALKTPTEN